jgi:hypothetical protein
MIAIGVRACCASFIAAPFFSPKTALVAWLPPPAE